MTEPPKVQGPQTLLREMKSLLLILGNPPMVSCLRGGLAKEVTRVAHDAGLLSSFPTPTLPSHPRLPSPGTLSSLMQKPFLFLLHFFKLPEDGKQVSLDPHQNHLKDFPTGKCDSSLGLLMQGDHKPNQGSPQTFSLGLFQRKIKRKDAISIFSL